jgi:hypothetical protein
MLINASVDGTSVSQLSGGNSYAVINAVIHQGTNANFLNDDWGWLLGGGIRFPFVMGSALELEGRYTRGFHSITRQPEVYADPDFIYSLNSVSTTSIQHQTYMLSVELLIPINN